MKKLKTIKEKVMKSLKEAIRTVLILISGLLRRKGICRIRLGNEGDIHGVSITWGILEHVMETEEGFKYCHILTNEGTAVAQHISTLPKRWREVLRRQKVEYYSTQII